MQYRIGISKLYTFLFIPCMIVLGCIFFDSSVYALSSNDCNAYTAVTPEGYITSATQLVDNNDEPIELAFFTDDDLRTVFTHFKQYCCLELNAKDKCPDVPGLYYYAESPYIGDHLINIGFRKLDGTKKECKTLGLGSGNDCSHRQQVPNLSTERREKITEIAEDRAGYPPAQILALFKKYRGDNTSIDTSLAAKNQDNLAGLNTLRSQYIALCEEIGLLQERLDPVSGSETEYLVATNNAGLTKHCISLAHQRYKQEAQYVRTLMVEKGVQYIVQNLEAYSLDYLMDNRFKELSNKYTALEGCFANILTTSTNTACCNE